MGLLQPPVLRCVTWGECVAISRSVPLVSQLVDIADDLTFVLTASRTFCGGGNQVAKRDWKILKDDISLYCL
jgi:hypothetical protein